MMPTFAIAQELPQATAGQRAALLQAVTACRAVNDNQGRLACFDREVARLDDAERKREVVVVERSQVRAAKRSLFGLSLPRIALFEGPDEQKDEIREIESTIERTESGAYGKLLFVLADGSRWRQVDNRTIVLPPRAGTPVKVRRGVTTNYRLAFGGIGVAVKREN